MADDRDRDITQATRVTDHEPANIGDDVSRQFAEARAGLRTSELAVLAGRHLSIQQCAGGHCIVADGPCDHCGSTDPLNNCQFITIGTPLITR